MGMPIRYNIRNLFRRKLRTFLTILGIALVIAIAVIMMAYSRGLMMSLRNNGDPENAMVMSRRATDRGFSSLKQSQFDILAAQLQDQVAQGNLADLPGAKKDPLAGAEELLGGGLGGSTSDYDYDVDLVTPYLSHSFLMQVDSDLEGEAATRRGLVLGVDPERAFFMHDDFRLKEGRYLTVGDERAVMVGSIAYARLDLQPEDLAVGKSIHFSGLDWKIVGTFEAPGSGADGEIWVPLEQLQTILNRSDVNFLVVKAPTEGGMREIVDFINKSDQTELRAVSEQEYYRGYAETFNTFALIGWIMAIVITLGGVMVGMNTMYTAISGRIREIGMLQVQGFSKRAILTSFLLESVLIALVGGALGCALGSLVNGMPMKVTMGVFLFRVDRVVLAAGMGLAILIGLVGAFVPALRAVRIRMVEAMRYM